MPALRQLLHADVAHASDAGVTSVCVVRGLEVGFSFPIQLQLQISSLESSLV